MKDVQTQLQTEYKTINDMWKIVKKWVEKVPLEQEQWGEFADEIREFANSRGGKNDYMYALGSAIIHEIEDLHKENVTV